MTDLFEIVEEDVRGVRLRVFKHSPPSLRAIWLASAAHGDNDYLVYQDERYTFADVHRIVASLARTLESYGVQPGDRVAIAMRNYPEWGFAFWAGIVVGAVVVPLNAWWTGPELAYGLSDSGAVVLFADEERAERIAPLIGDTAVRNIVLARTERFMPNAETFDQAVGGLDAPPIPYVEVLPDDDATIMYTSGTTGRPKGAVATHRNFTAFLMNLMYRQSTAAAAAAATATAKPAVPALPPATLLTFPLFHVGGLQSSLMVFAAIGGKIVLMYKWDPVQAVELIEREGVTSVSGVPTTMFQMLEVAHKQGRELPSLGSVASGATLVPPELVRRIDRGELKPDPSNVDHIPA
jgi:acyl-CoA synthetase (AMP-forming)/AMP-acid ligase II